MSLQRVVQQPPPASQISHPHGTTVLDINKTVEDTGKKVMGEFSKERTYVMDEYRTSWKLTTLTFHELMASYMNVLLLASAKASSAVSAPIQALLVGGSLAVTVSLFGGASGNPMMLLAGRLTNKLQSTTAMFLGLFFQLVGALLAVLTAKWAYGLSADGVGTLLPVFAVDNNNLVLLEIVGAFFAIYAYIISMSKNNRFPFPVGAVVAAVCVATLPSSGSTLNPFYHAATAVWHAGSSENSKWWIYWVGGFCAVVLTVVLNFCNKKINGRPNNWVDFEVSKKQKDDGATDTVATSLLP